MPALSYWDVELEGTSSRQKVRCAKLARPSPAFLDRDRAAVREIERERERREEREKRSEREEK